MTDNRTNEPGRCWCDHPEMNHYSGESCRVFGCICPRFALAAAQGAAPQADGENAAVARAIRIWTRQVRSELEATAEANIQLGEDYLHGIRSALMQAEDHAARLENDLYGDKPTPVLPSSGVDEAALAEVIANARNRWAIYGRKDELLEPYLSRAVAEWLKVQGG